MSQPLGPNPVPIEDLALSLQALGALKRSQIYTVQDLLHYTEEDLRILDQPSSAEVVTALRHTFDLILPTEDALV
jgi:DNA-directed RNA polymerase alpha subunit